MKVRGVEITDEMVKRVECRLGTDWDFASHERIIAESAAVFMVAFRAKKEQRYSELSDEDDE